MNTRIILDDRDQRFYLEVANPLLAEKLKEKVKPHLISLLGSMEESERKSNGGKQRRRFMGMMLKNIEDFKENHSWTLWNVVHKTLMRKNQELQLKEV